MVEVLIQANGTQYSRNVEPDDPRVQAMLRDAWISGYTDGRRQTLVLVGEGFAEGFYKGYTARHEDAMTAWKHSDTRKALDANAQVENTDRPVGREGMEVD